MSPSIVWLSGRDPAFPSSLAQDLGEKTPKRIATLGNLAILHSKTLALICSVKCPGNLILQTYDVSKDLRAAEVSVIGGFHSPMERECLRIFLRGSTTDYHLPGQKLGGNTTAQRIQEASEPRALAPPLAVFSQASPNNDKDITLSEPPCGGPRRPYFVPYASPSGKTEQLCADVLARGKRIYTLVSEATLHLTAASAQPMTSFQDFR